MIAPTKHSISAVATIYVCSWQWRSLAPQICQIFPIPMTFSAISPRMRDFLHCQKRSLKTWQKSKSKYLQDTKTWLKVFNDWKVQCNEARKLEDIPCHELDAFLCHFFHWITIYSEYFSLPFFKLNSRATTEYRATFEGIYIYIYMRVALRLARSAVALALEGQGRYIREWLGGLPARK